MPATLRTIADIDCVFSDWDRPDFPGVAVGIVRDGEPIYTRCFGLANVEHGVPITPSTVFDIGSMTKQFTALATLMLVRDGKLDMDDDVRDYIPELSPHDPPVRVRHCLYHTSGLTDWIEALELAGPTCDYRPIKRAHRTIIALRDTMFPAGQAHSYSNTGYVLLAWIVFHVTGKTLPEFLKERVLDPLGMSHSVFRSDPFEFFPNQAQGYFRDESDRLFRASGASDVCGDGGMQASIGDMTRWLSNFTAREVGDAALFERFFAPGHLDDGRVLRYGAGWVLDRYRGLQAIQHGGMAEGFQSYILWVPEVSIGVAVLGNVRPYLPWRLATGAVDTLLGERRAMPSATAGAASRKCLRPEQDDLAGRYFTATGLPVAVDWYGEQLRIDIWLWGRPFDELSLNNFREEHSGDIVTFHRDKGGSVTHFTLETDDGACSHMHSLISRAVKYDFTALDRSEMAQFEGRYANDEIESTYTIVADKDGLTARHLRCFDWHLRPIKSNDADAFGDDFAQERTWPGMVTFERSSGGAVTGFRVRGVRVNLFFRKLLPEASDANRPERL